MSFCQTCGTSLPEGAAACPACGAVHGVAAPGAAPGAMPGSYQQGAYPPQGAYSPQGSYPPGQPVYAAPPQPAAGAGLTPNVAGALAYLAGFITGILFLVIDPFKNDRFVRFHAFQSIFFNVAWIAFWIAWTIVGFVLGAVSHGLFFIIQLPVNLLVLVGGFCLWAYMMYAAYQGKTFQLPVIGPLAAKQAGVPVVGGQRL